MYTSISIEGFRCFSRFELHGLDRINLLVGANNSGKTALLEAVGLLASEGRSRAIVEAALRRGEVVHGEDRMPRADARRIFHGHVMAGDVLIRLLGTTSGEEQELILRAPRFKKVIREVEEDGHREIWEGLREDDEASDSPRYLARQYERPGSFSSDRIPLGPEGGLIWSLDDHDLARKASSVRFIPTNSLSGDEAVELISPLLLTDGERPLLDAIRMIDDQIIDFRVAPLPLSRRYHSRECIIVKLHGIAAPVPIGSLGDGVWRLFTLATAIASAAGGVVLVDDIDTGLHYSVMEQMWRYVAAVASRLDVQIFATTHSRDCYEALAAVEEGCATIHRIERGRTQSVVFGGAMVTAAAANDIEVR